MSGFARMTARSKKLCVPADRHRFDWRRNPGFGTFFLGVLFYLYMPLVVLVVYSFNANRSVTVWSSFTFDWFVSIAHNEGIRDAAWISAMIATAATLCSTSVAIAAALAFERGSIFRGRALAVGLISMPLVVPEIVVAISMLIFFSSIGIQSGYFKLIISHTVICVPFAMLPIQARLNAIGSSFEDAGRDLYGSEWRIFRRITVPLMMPGVAAGAVLAFVTSFDDFLISFMMGGAGTTTLPVYVYGMIRTGVTPEVNAMSVILLAISALLALFAFLIFRPGKGDASTS